ncbi:hypothetical protein NE865_06630 [Phthorimaea operculella]|nr:hypothetical protein NE865_06630 [Phthorimaea operculella]
MDPPKVVSTDQIHNWIQATEVCLSEICTLTGESKLNMEQKIKVQNLCRKISTNNSQVAAAYQSAKQHAISNYKDHQATLEKEDILVEIQKLKECIKETAQPQTSLTFADAIKTGTKSVIRPSNLSSIAIYPNDKLKSSEETKTLVQKIIKPEEMKLHVRGLRRVKNGGVIISTDSKEDIEKLKQSVQLNSCDVTIDEPHKRKPRIIVIGLPATMPEKDVYKCIYEQNLADKLQDWTWEKFLSSIKLSHKSDQLQPPARGVEGGLPPSKKKDKLTFVRDTRPAASASTGVEEDLPPSKKNDN